MAKRSAAIQAWTGLLVLALSQPAMAANTSLGGVSARGRSVGNAFSAIADDPSAVYYNPAGLVQIRGTQLLVDFLHGEPTLDYDSSTSSTGSKSSSGVYDPSLFISTDALKKVTLGFGVFAPFARRTSYETNAAVGALRHQASLLRLDFAPTVAVDLGRGWSVGGGLTASRVALNSDVLGFKESAHGYGFAGQLGVLYRGIDSLQFGLSYRGKMQTRVSGHGAISPFPGPGDLHSSTLHFPDIINAGVAWGPADRWLLSFGLSWETWHYFNEFNRNYDNAILKAAGSTKVQARNTLGVQLGTTYSWSDKTSFSAGYEFQPRATPANRIIPAQPDYGFQVFSIGLGRAVGRSRVNLNYNYVHSAKESNHGALFPGSYSLRAHVLSLNVTIPLGGDKK